MNALIFSSMQGSQGSVYHPCDMLSKNGLKASSCSCVPNSCPPSLTGTRAGGKDLHPVFEKYKIDSNAHRKDAAVNGGTDEEILSCLWKSKYNQYTQIHMTSKICRGY